MGQNYEGSFLAGLGAYHPCLSQSSSAVMTHWHFLLQLIRACLTPNLWGVLLQFTRRIKHALLFFR